MNDKRAVILNKHPNFYDGSSLIDAWDAAPPSILDDLRMVVDYAWAKTVIGTPEDAATNRVRAWLESADV